MCHADLGMRLWLSNSLGTQFRLYFSGDWDVHWGYGIWTHGYISRKMFAEPFHEPLLRLEESFRRGPSFPSELVALAV